MIIDHIDNGPLYYCLGARIEAGLRFLKTADLNSLPLGKNAIRGDELYAMAFEYMTKDHAECKWEAHRRYIDIQYVVEGTESVGWQCLAGMEPISAYDDKNDAVFLRGSGNHLLLQPGYFIVFMPHDAHRGGLMIKQPAKVRKVVVKALAP